MPAKTLSHSLATPIADTHITTEEGTCKSEMLNNLSEVTQQKKIELLITTPQSMFILPSPPYASTKMPPNQLYFIMFLL